MCNLSAGTSTTITLVSGYNPGSLCVNRMYLTNAPPVTALANYSVKVSEVDAANGGTMTLQTVVQGFVGTACRSLSNKIYAVYSLSSSNGSPTNFPTPAPVVTTPAPQDARIGTSSLVFAPAASSIKFSFTGGPQTWEVPQRIGFIHIDACGGQGGSLSSNQGYGALPGRVSTIIYVSPCQTLYIHVGGPGVASRGTLLVFQRVTARSTSSAGRAMGTWC